MKNDLEKKVMRKVTLRIIPFIMLLYFIAFLDRVNIGFAALTMNQDLGFSPTVFGLGAGIFFLGYFLFEVPSNLILHKVGARIWIARVMITWGFVSGCMAFVQGTTSFYILRFLLGVAEAGFFRGSFSISATGFLPPGVRRSLPSLWPQLPCRQHWDRRFRPHCWRCMASLATPAGSGCLYWKLCRRWCSVLWFCSS